MSTKPKKEKPKLKESPQQEGMKIYDNTMLSDMLTCPRYFYNRHIKGYVNVQDPKIAAEFGSAVHDGVEVLYQGGEIEAATLKFCDTFNPFLEHADNKHNLETGELIVTAYAELYPLEKEAFATLDTELAFTIELGSMPDDAGNDIPVLYFGRIDVIGELPNQGKIAIDHKTTGRISELYMNSVHPNRQFTGYVIALREHYEDVYGCMLNAIQKPYTKKDGSLTLPDFGRQLSQRSEVECKMWVVETIQIIKWIDMCIKDRVWPMDAPFSCSKWFKQCPYHFLCTQKVPLNDIMVPESMYEVDFWTPIKEEDRT